MTKQEIARQTFEYIAERYNDSNAPFSCEDSLLENGIIDSQGLVELIAFLERQFSIHIRDEDVNLENFTSILTISSFVANSHQD